MLFNSLEFGIFLGVVFALALLLPHRAQNRLLLLASYVFYAAWDWRFLALIGISTGVDFWVGLRLARTSDPRARRRWLGLSLAVNLGLLGFFKYAGFFVESFAELLSALGASPHLPTLRFVLPVGISFYTFQTLSYSIDVYRGRLEPTRRLLDFALFVALFPQLVAGPIERARHLLPQVLQPRRIGWGGVGSGCWLILWGLFKKTVVADNLAPLVDAVYDPGSQPAGAEVAFATYAFALQIYCDFSGYTDIARGAGRLLGFDLMLNFRLPYFAASPREFWRRWHVSLSTWLRDYLYVPLGGDRRGRRRTLVNLFLTMLLGGLWHGAAWTFLAWGAYHGALLVAHRWLEPTLERVAPADGAARALWTALCVFTTFQLVCLGWLLFRAESLGHAGALLAALGTAPGAGLVPQWLAPLLVLAGPLLLFQLAQARSGDLEPLRGLAPPWRGAFYAAVFFAIVLLGEDFGEPFLYFQF